MFANSKKVTTFAPAIEREILDKKDGPFVYRLDARFSFLKGGFDSPTGYQIKKLSNIRIASLFFILLCAGYADGSVRKRLSLKNLDR